MYMSSTDHQSAIGIEVLFFFCLFCFVFCNLCGEINKTKQKFSAIPPPPPPTHTQTWSGFDRSCDHAGLRYCAQDYDSVEVMTLIVTCWREIRILFETKRRNAIFWLPVYGNKKRIGGGGVPHSTLVTSSFTLKWLRKLITKLTTFHSYDDGTVKFCFTKFRSVSDKRHLLVSEESLFLLA